MLADIFTIASVFAPHVKNHLTRFDDTLAANRKIQAKSRKASAL